MPIKLPKYQKKKKKKHGLPCTLSGKGDNRKNYCYLSLHDGDLGLRLNDGLFVKLQQLVWGLTICLWLGITLARSGCRIREDYSSLFIILIYLSLMHRLSWEPLCEPNFYTFLN